MKRHLRLVGPNESVPENKPEIIQKDPDRQKKLNALADKFKKYIDRPLERPKHPWETK